MCVISVFLKFRGVSGESLRPQLEDLIENIYEYIYGILRKVEKFLKGASHFAVLLRLYV